MKFVEEAKNVKIKTIGTKIKMKTAAKSQTKQTGGKKKTISKTTAKRLN